MSATTPIQQLAAMEVLRASGWTFSGPAQGRLQLMTVAEVASVLAFCRRSIERMLDAGEFPGARRFGSEIRIPVADVEALIARQPLAWQQDRRLAA
ncbi:MAG: Helix-turn-helix domain [Betaproteobacteria bacterium]|nr:Helix-turn-helix domain [Betaproteobacteria bacterium]